MVEKLSGKLNNFVLLILAFGLIGFLTKLCLDQLVHIRFIGIDDAHIFFRYAENFISEQALVWNAGGEKVEGFTSFAWLACSTLAAYFFDDYYIALLFLNVLLISLSAFLVVSFLLKLLEEDQSSSLSLKLLLVLFPISLFCNFGVISWGVTSLMDTGLWIFSVTLSTYLLLSKHLINEVKAFSTKFILALILLILTRPEGVAVGFGLIIIDFLLSWANNNKNVKSTSLYVLVFFGAYILLSLIRLSYFGELFPNTYYAKVGSDKLYNLSEGYGYFLSWLFTESNSYILVVLICMFLASLSIKPHSNLIKYVFALLLMVAGFIFISIYVGGDHFGYYRHYQVLIPIIAFIAGLTLLILWEKTSSPSVYILIILFTLWSPLTFYGNNSEIKRLEIEYGIVVRGQEIGKFLEETLPHPLPLIATVSIGGISTSYSGPIYDLMGLVNKKMAHNSRERYGAKNHAAFDPEVFLEDKPDYLIFTRIPCKDNNSEVVERLNQEVLKGLLDMQEFNEFYRPITIVNPKATSLIKKACGYKRVS